MPTPVPPATAVTLDAWLSALAVAQPDASISAPPSAPAPAPAPAPTGQPNVLGMPQDATTNPGGATSGAGQTGALGGGGGPAKPAPANDMFMFLMWGMIALFVVMIFTSSRTAKREKKKREELMSSLRRGDKVQTIGGMIGKVVELRDDEVVLEGENPGTKFRFARSAIQQVVRQSSESGSAPEVEVKAGKEGSKV